MIAIHFSPKTRQDYESWLKTVKKDLEKQFDVHLSDSKQWIKEKPKVVIQSYLFPLTHDKCVYCERQPNVGGGDLELDHFYPKSWEEYRDLVFSPENLLPACKQCNRNKGVRFKGTNGFEMLNPYKIKSVSQHLKINPASLKIEGISGEGKATVEILSKSLNLNRYSLTEKDEETGEVNTKRVRGALMVRQTVESSVREKMKCLIKFIELGSYEDAYEQVCGLFELISPKKQCTATYATLILGHQELPEILKKLRDQNQENAESLELLLKEKEQYMLST